MVRALSGFTVAPSPESGDKACRRRNPLGCATSVQIPPQTFLRFAAFPPRSAFHDGVLTICGCDLTRSAVPVLLVPTVGLTLSLPQRISTPCDLLVYLLVPPRFSKTRLTLPWTAGKLSRVWSLGRDVCRQASARGGRIGSCGEYSQMYLPLDRRHALKKRRLNVADSPLEQTGFEPQVPVADATGF